MAVAVEAVGGSTGNSGSPGAVSFTITSANLLLVGISLGDDGTLGAITGVTWNGTSMTAVASSDGTDGGIFEAVRWYSMASPASGTHNVQLSVSRSVQWGVHVVSFTGASSTLGTPSVNHNTTTNPSVTVVDSASGDIVVSLFSNDNNGTTTVPQSGTSIVSADNVGSDSDMWSQYQTASGASTVCSVSNSSAGATWAASGVAVKAGAASGQPAGRRTALCGSGFSDAEIGRSSGGVFSEADLEPAWSV